MHLFDVMVLPSTSLHDFPMHVVIILIIVFSLRELLASLVLSAILLDLCVRMVLDEK
jgi:hypothetical protein